MLNAKMGIFFVRGEAPNDYLDALSEGHCVYVSNYDLKEWYIDLELLQKDIP